MHRCIISCILDLELLLLHDKLRHPLSNLPASTERMKLGYAVRLSFGIFLLASPDVVTGFSRPPRVSSHARIQGQGGRQLVSSQNFKLRVTALDPVIRVYDPLFQHAARPIQPLKGIAATMTKIGMMLYIASMCVALPIALFPPFILCKMGLIPKMRQEQLSLRAGQFCARWLLRLIPFCHIKAIPYQDEDPQPSIWVCNHASALDVFMLLAADKTLRGKRKRPLKIVYVSKEIWHVMTA